MYWLRKTVSLQCFSYIRITSQYQIHYINNEQSMDCSLLLIGNSSTILESHGTRGNQAISLCLYLQESTPLHSTPHPDLYSLYNLGFCCMFQFHTVTMTVVVGVLHLWWLAKVSSWVRYLPDRTIWLPWNVLGPSPPCLAKKLI